MSSTPTVDFDFDLGDLDDDVSLDEPIDDDDVALEDLTRTSEPLLRRDLVDPTEVISAHTD